MKQEDVLFLLVSLFISVILFCLIVNGDPTEKERSLTFIDSVPKVDTIKDELYLTKNLNENEETNFCFRTSFRNNVCFM